MHDLIAIFSGSLVGLILGLIGGGGSILAVPLLVYLVGVKDPHVAIGTAAVAVGVNALSSLIGHIKLGNVRWPCALLYAASGIIGASIGASIGKQFNGQRLLILFGLLMLVVAAMMMRRKSESGATYVRLSPTTASVLAPRLGGFGFATGALSGFFGIGGGFLIVPGLIAASDMPMIAAVGSSLVSVAAFGLTTAVSYAHSGLVNWRLVMLFVFGGFFGSYFGSIASTKLSVHKKLLSQIFAAVVAVVGLYVTVRGLIA